MSVAVCSSRRAKRQGRKLLWSAVVGADNYTIEIGTETGVYTRIVEVGAGTSYDLDALSLAPGVTHFLVVRGNNGDEVVDDASAELEILDGAIA